MTMDVRCMRVVCALDGAVRARLNGWNAGEMAKMEMEMEMETRLTRVANRRLGS